MPEDMSSNCFFPLVSPSYLGDLSLARACGVVVVVPTRSGIVWKNGVGGALLLANEQ